MFPKLRAIVFAVFGLAALTASAQQTINVPADQPTIQAGINAANNGDTVLVACGTYYEHINFMGKAIRVIGAGYFPTQGGCGSNVSTIIDAGGVGSPVSFTSGEGRSSFLADVVAQNAGPPISGTPGGQYAGGGIYVYKSSPTLFGATAANNSCVGVNVYEGAPEIFGTDVRATTTSSACTYANGVGISIYGAYQNPPGSALRPVVYRYASYDNQGVGILVSGGNPMIQGNDIYSNNTGASSPYPSGGGILVADGGATITDNAIYTNQSSSPGAGIAILEAADTTTPVTVINNAISNNTLSGAASGDGVQAYVSATRPVIFVNNVIFGTSSAATFGCGATAQPANPITLVLDHNSIFNTQGALFGSTCLSQTGYGNIFVNPELENNVHTTPGSPLIDGNNSAPNLPPIDIIPPGGPFNGTPNRIQDTNGLMYPVVDISPYEQSGAEYDGSGAPYPDSDPFAPTFLYPEPLPYSVPIGSTYTIVANLTCAAATPTGTVTFLEDMQVIGTGTINATGTASITTQPLTAGSHAMLETYSGDTNCSPAESVKAWLYVNGLPAIVTTSATLTSLPNPSVLGQAVVFSAKIAAASGGSLPTGTMTLFDGSATLGTQPVAADGAASFTVSSLAIGTHTVSVVYNPTGNFATSSASVVQTVLPGEMTNLALTSSLNPSNVGVSVIFTAFATTANGDIPSGSVQFSDGTTVLGTGTLNASGYATLSTATLAIGSHNITGAYAPDTTTYAASAGALTQVVDGLTSSAMLTVSPSSGAYGSPFMMSAVIAGQSGSPTPTGTVTFSANGYVLATQSVTSGTASYTATALPAGTDNISCTYSGDANYAASTCNTVSVTVNATLQTITFPQPAGPYYAGTVIPISASTSSGLPVTFTVVSGPATIVNTSLNSPTTNGLLSITGAGAVVIEADQAGDANYTAAPPVQETFAATLLTAPVGSTVTAETFILVNQSGTVGSIAWLTQGAPNLDFKDPPRDDCVVKNTLGTGDYCSIVFSFTPTLPGMRYGGIVLTSTTGAVMGSTYIYGVGTGPQVDYLPGVQSILSSGFTQPAGLAFDGSGNLFVADDDGNSVKELFAASGYTTANTISAGLTSPVGIAIDGNGNLFVAENNTVSDVKEIFAAGGYSNFATLGSGFDQPADLAVDGNGNVFVADMQNNAVKEITAASGYTTIVTLAGNYSSPAGVAVDGNGNVFVADYGHSQVKEILAASSYTTVNTLPGSFAFLTQVKVDASGNVFVASQNQGTLQELIAASGYATAETLGSGLEFPSGIALDGLGNVIFSDYYDHTVVKLDYADAPTLTFAATPVGSTSSDSPQTVTTFNNGTAALTFSAPGSGNNPSITPGFTFGSSSTCPQLNTSSAAATTLAMGASCTNVVSFTPIATGPDNGTLVTTDNNLNNIGATQTVLLNGAGTLPAPTIVFTVPNQTFGNPPFTVAATSNSPGAFTYSVVSGPATILGSTVTLTGTGTVTLEASQAATATYAAGSATATFVVAGTGQPITFPAPVEPAYAGTSVTLTATARSNVGVSYAVLSGPATVSGSTLTYTGAGTVIVEASTASVTLFASAMDTVTTTLLTEPVATTSPVVTTVVTFTAAGTLGAATVLTQGATGLDFSAAPGGNCVVGMAYAAGDTCTFAFTFTPTEPGIRYGGIVLADGDGNVLANSYIYGVGTGPQVIWNPGTQSALGSGFIYPSGVAVNGNGDVFVSDETSGLIQEILPNGTIENLASIPDATDVVVDGSGNLFISSYTNVDEIAAVNGNIPAAPTVRVLATVSGDIDGLAVDGSGNVYFGSADLATNTGPLQEILAVNGMIPASPTVLTLATFSALTGVAVDASGDVFASDQATNAVSELVAVNGSIPASPTIRTLASGLSTPTNVEVDGSGNVFVPQVGLVQELLAVNGSIPATPAIKTLGSGFGTTSSVALDGKGNVLVSEEGSQGVVKLDYADPPTLNFATTPVGATSSDSPQTVTMTNNGNAELDFLPPVGAATNPSITAGFTFTSTCPTLGAGPNVAYAVAAGDSCPYAVSFTPVATGPDSGALTLTDNNLNVMGAMQSVPLNGVGTPSVAVATTTTLIAAPNPAGQGQAVTFGITVAAQSGTAAPTGTVTLSEGTTTLATLTLTPSAGAAISEASTALSTLAPGVHVLIATYTPVPANGSFSGSVSAPLTVTITMGDFTLSAAPPSLTVQTEHHGTVTLTVTSLGGFAGPVQFGTAGPVPMWVTPEFAPAGVELAANGTASVQLTIDTDAVLDFKSEAAPAGPFSRSGLGTIALAGIALGGLPLLLLGRKRRLRVLLVAATMAVLAMGLTACGDKYPDHTTPGTYQIPITATGIANGSTVLTTHTLELTLVVTE